MFSVKGWTLVFTLVIYFDRGYASVKEVKGALGREVSFGLDTIAPDMKSIVWKQKTNTETVKAIEWDEDGTVAPNPRFKDVTSLNLTTGVITIKNLKNEHGGLYTIDVNSKEQEQKFNLDFIEPVPKPVITTEKIEGNPDAVYLRCEYSDTIIWRSSDGETLEGANYGGKGTSITVKNTKNKDKSYTCTLKNEASEETSNRVYERDLFKESSGGLWWIGLIVLIILVVVVVLLYNFYPKLKKRYTLAASNDRGKEDHNKAENATSENHEDEHPA